MAPVKSIQQRLTRPKPATGNRVTKSTLFDDDFRTTKRDKRIIKHASFVSKIEKSSAKSTKRRRASKKLLANLESLADALPETETELGDPSKQINIIKQKTLKHKPGAMKRKEKLEKLERERFAKNMAQMSNMQPAPAPTSKPDEGAGSVSNRWAALRGFISQTMEQQPAFKTNK
ncbi:hypothetical protein P175DRAFT_0455370 [Aspergillus ochraceoroseus IBT 24754]|uniref:Ribosome biogenesis protein SLX9 n=3 Tax=Aspergillus subgen. Nidulantes TaxID=2720870 RepID=A0A0F8WLX0_9EURO|nr:uncharacterized protein P175DRAFT_0455370 [Aspergillus ochraceoroseus IBT 24754]KKK18705.1 hypothetical protein ARAM_001209 [Aspergillus rambellii]KKK23751.1 hypothetical protein AOCH_000673 [Aspergillus ochraceoroseus]PTU23496.1 hypothetical protein P175DRAFT_0455370 [Aspergillus ochraceoroseus IBT 24754]